MSHLLLNEVAHAAAALRSLADVQTIYLNPGEKADLLTQCVALEAMTVELRMRVMLDAGDLVESSPERSIAEWLAAHAGMYRGTASTDLHLAEALTGWSCVSAAMRVGTVSREQARVIVRSLERLPDELDEHLLGEAEQYLVEKASEFGPHELGLVGEKLLEVIAPDDFDRLEALRLQRQDDRARQRQRLSLKARGDGLTAISGLLPDSVAVRLATYLHAFSNPRREETKNLFGEPTGLAKVPYPRRAAEAFAQLLETWDPKRLPIHGGDATTLMVTVTLDQLRTELATAGLLDAGDDGGEAKITAAEARRLACTAQIVPVVLGSHSEVLDQGRSQRLFQKAQVRALHLRDRTCRAEGCHVPGTWAEAHHWIAWQQGGTTNLENAVLLCSHHHHLAHHHLWTADRLAGGDVRFVLRT